MTDDVATSTEVRLSEITNILTSFPLSLKRSVFSVVTALDELLFQSLLGDVVMMINSPVCHLLTFNSVHTCMFSLQRKQLS